MTRPGAPALLLIALLLGSGHARAADGEATLSGRVHALGSPDPIVGALIQVQGSDLSALTDGRGRFSAPLAPGTWVLRVSADGYAPLSRTVALAPGKSMAVVWAMNPVEFQSSTVVVTAHREHPQPIQASITKAEIKQIPGSFGDALRAVQDLPGIGQPNDFSGQILMQGGGPQDNLFLLDAMPWPIPYHFGGLVSTVNTNLLDKVDVYEAGYGGRWGGALSGVLDAKTGALDKDRLHLDADLNLIDSSLMLDGPLGLGDATFAVTGRRSYIDLIAGLAGLTVFPYFWDSQGVLDFSLDKDNTVHLLAMGSDDELHYSHTATSPNDSGVSGTITDTEDYQSLGFTWTNTRFDHVVSRLTPYVNHTDLLFGIDQFVVGNYRTNYGLKEEAVWSTPTWLSVDHELGLGGSVELADYRFHGFFPRITSTANITFSQLTNTPATPSTVNAQGLNSYAYVQDRMQLDPAWILTVGLHYDTTSLTPDGRVGPRTSLIWKPEALDQLTAAWGLYDQAPSPLNVNPQFGNPSLVPEEAEHTALSYEHRFTTATVGMVDAYYKSLSDLVVSDPSNPALYDNQGQGEVAGADFGVRTDVSAQTYAWITYSLEDSRRKNLPVQGWTLYQYDYPNILNLVGSYGLSPQWSFSAKFRYNSGNLVEPPGSDVYSQRLAPYARLDLGLDHPWRFQSWTLRGYLDVINVLNRKNPALQAVNNATGQEETVDDLPRLPYIGLEAKY